jgi:hypothetical protein
MVAREDVMLINTDGTKLRFGESILTEIGDFPISDFILYRKLNASGNAARFSGASLYQSRDKYH